MKKYGKLYLLLVLTISLSLTAFAPQTASGEAEMNRPDKIDAALWDVMLIFHPPQGHTAYGN